MKHIAYLYDHILDVGGAENHILSLFRCLNGAGYRFSIISRTSHNFQSRAEQLGARVFTQPARKLLDPIWVLDLVRRIRSEKIDLLHIHGAIAAAPGRIAAAICSIPAVVTFHNPASRYHGTLRTPRARIGRSLYVTIDRWLNHVIPGSLIYVSRSFLQEEIRSGRTPAGKSAYIPNGINLETFRLSPAPRPALPLQVLFIGRLAEEKGCDILIQALSFLSRDITPLECLIVGEGPLRAQLEAQAWTLSSPDRPVIRFLGFRGDINQLMANADLFVLPSRSESASLALIEALASGLPSIVTATGDSPQLIENGPAGVCIPPGDAKALAREMARVLADEPLRRKMAEAARRNSQIFDENETARQVLRIYQRLLGEL